MNIIGLDAETYSPTNITRGLKNYFADPEFKVLLVAVSMLNDKGPGVTSHVLDFVKEPDIAREMLKRLLNEGGMITAHNAMFEYLMLHKLGLHIDATRFIDSAVVASIAGGGRSLEAAAPQLLDVEKMAFGKEGIQLFCIPGTYQMENGNDAFDPRVVEDHPEQWEKFAEYCALDAVLSLELVDVLRPMLDDEELLYAALTMQMNLQGWKVNMDLVEEMDRRYRENTEALVAEFKETCDAPDLNLFSSQQLSKWCADRGVKAESFDEKHVSRLMGRLEKKLEQIDPDDKRRTNYEQVLHMLRTKQALGGSSLKKLRTIKDTVAPDGRLYDQYAHAGAGTTLRTSGRGVQMQNLHRIGGNPDDMADLFDKDIHWSNAKMAKNLRQVFTATDPFGFLVVGDYSAVESRGLAWFAGEDWKLDAYRKGIDVYKMQAGRFFDTALEDVSPDQRQFGKVGELSCGYYAGWEAVKSFAEKMGIMLTEGQARKLVQDFRRTNPKTQDFWHALQAALNEAMEFGMGHVTIPHGTIDMMAGPALGSIMSQEPGTDLRTLVVDVKVPMKDDVFKFRRIFHGVYRHGNNICYFRPSERKTGNLWVPDFTDPKTGAKRKYSLYGGKLAGVLTQSLCRQIFMHGMGTAYLAFLPTSNVRLIGQLHDELALDVSPPETVLDMNVDEVMAKLKKIMSSTDLPGFPLAAEVKKDYHYTK